MRGARREVVVTGAALLCPAADSPAALHAALVAGDDLTGLAAPPEALEAARLAFDARARLPEGNPRPIDRVGQLVTATAGMALRSSGWAGEVRSEREIGLVLGTLFSGLHTISSFDLRGLEAGPRYVKPLDFANTVINAPAGQAAIWHGLRGVNSTVAGTATAGLQALAQAEQLIRAGRADVLVAGGADELCREVQLAFAESGLLAAGRDGSPARPVPFDVDRNGCALSEGAAFLVLEEAGLARARGATSLGTIRGHATGFDSSRGRNAEDAASTVARVVRLALEDAGADVRRLAAVSASANGSVAGDRSEAVGIARALEQRAGAIPVTAVKSVLGEPLGPAGVLQAEALLESMRTGTLPGIRGLARLDPDVPLPGASPEPQRLDSRCGVVTAVGLHGDVCALVLEAH